jgi:hypothetical protein
MWWAMGQSKPPYKVVLKVEASGYRRGKQVEIDASIEHEDGYELTAIPVVALLKQYDYIRRPGLHMMGHLADPDCLFQDMERMGAKVTTTIR